MTACLNIKKISVPDLVTVLTSLTKWASTLHSRGLQYVDAWVIHVYYLILSHKDICTNTNLYIIKQEIRMSTQLDGYFLSTGIFK
jgi:hypothetical protein